MKRIMIVCDLGHFKVFEVKKNPSGSWRLSLVKEMDIREAHEKLGEMVTDSAGVFGMGGQRGSLKGYGEKHSLEEEIERKIVKKIAEEINSICSHTKPDIIYFSAPSKIYSSLVERINPAVKSSIKRSIKADLTKHTKEELIEKFLF